MPAAKTWTFTVQANSKPRLDHWLVRHLPALSRAQLQRLISGGQVTVDGVVVRAAARLKRGQQIIVTEPVQRVASRVEPYPLEIDVVYEDKDLAIVNKPADLVMHPAPGHPIQTLANAVAYRWPSLPSGLEDGRPGIVHRLDKDTSGLVVIAKSTATQFGLQQQFKNRHISKKYIALIEGFLSPMQGVVEVPLGPTSQTPTTTSGISSGRSGTNLTTWCEISIDQLSGKQVPAKPCSPRDLSIHFGGTRALYRANSPNSSSYGLPFAPRGRRCSLWIAKAPLAAQAPLPPRLCY